MRKHTPKPKLNLSGNMNQKDTGAVGKILARASLVAACAPVIWAIGRAVSEIIHALRWW